MRARGKFSGIKHSSDSLMKKRDIIPLQAEIYGDFKNTKERNKKSVRKFNTSIGVLTYDDLKKITGLSIGYLSGKIKELGIEEVLKMRKPEDWHIRDEGIKRKKVNSHTDVQQ